MTKIAVSLPDLQKRPASLDIAVEGSEDMSFDGSNCRHVVREELARSEVNQLRSALGEKQPTDSLLGPVRRAKLL